MKLHWHLGKVSMNCRLTWPAGNRRFEIQTWLPGFVSGTNSLRTFCDSPVWADVTHYLGNDTVISFVINKQNLNVPITVWHKLRMITKLQHSWNKAIEYTGSYFTAEKLFPVLLFSQGSLTNLAQQVNCLPKGCVRGWRESSTTTLTVIANPFRGPFMDDF